MDDAKRRALIKTQAAKRKESSEVVSKGTAPSIKRKQQFKGDRPHKQQKVPLEPVVGLMSEGVKTVTPAKHGIGKGLMKALSTSQEKPPPLLYDDSKYALEKLSSIITSEDYEDLSNHSTEAMGEMGLFAIAHSLIMMKGLMDRCLNREMALERVRAKAEQTEDELGQLNKWKSTMEKKFELSEQVRKDLEQKTDEARKALEIKDKEIQDLKEKLHQAKEVAVREYRDFDVLLAELGDSFLQGFGDTLRQVKKAYPALDVSMVNVDDQAQTSAMPVASENTDDLFAEEAAEGDGESSPEKNVQDADPKE